MRHAPAVWDEDGPTMTGPIGIFDSGLGGLAVVEMVHRRDFQEVFRGQAAVRLGPDVVGRAIDLGETVR